MNAYQDRGETPIEKNVRVIDEQGNEYEATYPRRARGLVKSGRARFVDENKICLACPPNINLEDNKMTENINANVNVNAEAEAEAEAAEVKAGQEPTVAYIMTQLEKIRKDDKHIGDALEKICSIETGRPGDMGSAKKAESIADVVRCRETTNQKLIGFYEKVYNDLTRRKPDADEKIKAAKELLLSYLEGVSDNMDEDEAHEARNYVQSQIDLLVQEIMVGNN